MTLLMQSPYLRPVSKSIFLAFFFFCLVGKFSLFFFFVEVDEWVCLKSSHWWLLLVCFLMQRLSFERTKVTLNHEEQRSNQ